MTRPPRVQWLPALAVVLPCAFIGVLGFQWLALEREAAALRGAQAAERAAGALRRDLAAHLQAVGRDAAMALATATDPTRPFRIPPPAAAPASSVLLFDRSGTLVAPGGPAAYQAAVAAQKTDPVRRASALLTASRFSASAGRLEQADRQAIEITVCCRGARDEYGTAFVLYAAWQRARLYQRDRSRFGDRLDQLRHELQDLVVDGGVGSEADVATMALLTQAVGNRPDWITLLAEATRRRATFTELSQFADQAATWVRQADAAALERGPVVRFLASSEPEPAVIVGTGEDRVVVLRLESQALASWIDRWSHEHGAWRLALSAQSTSADAEVGTRVPLFADAPGWALLVQPPPIDPATEASRQQLLTAAVMGGVFLTVLVGWLAARDVRRELRTASLRSAFVAGVTHELKTPLASIRLLAETLRRGRARPDASPELLDTIVEESDRLGRLVDNVLSSSRIESGTRQYAPKVVSLPDAVRQAVRRFDYVRKQEGFEVIEEIDAAPIPVRVDPDALEQAVLNLLGNAIKYSGDSRRIVVSVEQRNGHALVHVVDRGIGIAHAEQSRVFETFYRSPEAGHTTGAGLGLALVRHFAEAHGGNVTVNSRPGEGSTFTLMLPGRATE